MSALISHFTDYVRKIWIKYRKLVTSRVSFSASAVVRESKYYCVVQYNTVYVQCSSVQYSTYCTLVARNRPDPF